MTLRDVLNEAARPLTLSRTAQNQALFTGVLAFVAASMVYLPGFPFPRAFAVVVIGSGVLHMVLFFYRDRLRFGHLFVVNFVDIGLLGCIVHYTGGIVSPYILVFASILLASSATGIEHPAIQSTAIGTYVLVVFLEYFGWLDPVPVSAADIYRSPWVTLLVVVPIVVNLAASGSHYDVILKKLRARVNAEQAQRQELLRRMGELESTSQLGGMVAKIAHDIHGPLTAIGGFVQILRENPRLDEESREDCRVILEEGDRIARMIERMLRYVKPGAEAKEPLCPREVVESVLTVIRFHPKSQGVRIEPVVSVDDETLVAGHKEGLQQVYFNIIKNALEAVAGRSGPEVRVAVSSDGVDCHIDIEDNGPGMSPELVRKVVEGYHTTKQGGTGLGLVIAREILAGHGGSLSIEAEEGRGTRIRTRLPLVKGTAGAKIAGG